MTRFIIKRVVFIAAKYLNRPRLTFSSKITERNFTPPYWIDAFLAAFCLSLMATAAAHVPEPVNQ